MQVENPKKQKLNVEVRDSLGFTEFTIGKAEVNHLKFPSSVSSFARTREKKEKERKNRFLL